MHKIALVAIATLCFTAPALAGMEIKDYPRNAAELEYCAKTYMNSDKVPEGCKTLGHRLTDKLVAAFKK